MSFSHVVTRRARHGLQPGGAQAEPENEFGEFGEERMIEIVQRHRNLPLEAVSEQVMQALRSWIGSQEQPDDITLVLARQR